MTIGAARLGFLTPSARADRDDGNHRRSEEHSRWSHSRSCDERGDREQARGEHHRGGERHHRGMTKEHARDGHHHGMTREHGRDGHHHGMTKEHGRQGHHRYASHTGRGREGGGDRDNGAAMAARVRASMRMPTITPAAVAIVASRDAIAGTDATTIAEGGNAAGNS